MTRSIIIALTIAIIAMGIAVLVSGCVDYQPGCIGCTDAVKQVQWRNPQ